MTDIERRALLGDRKAQEECTRRGIVLVCPFCGSKAERGANKRDSRKRYGVYHTIATVQCTACTAKVTMAGFYVETAYKYAEGRWNTRPAPPVGRCRECDSISFSSIDLGLKTKQPAEPAAEAGPPQNRGRAQ